MRFKCLDKNRNTDNHLLVFQQLSVLTIVSRGFAKFL